jgi:hypothetical protein
MKNELVYIAVPFSSPDKEVMESRFRDVNLASHILFDKGIAVFSPISMCWPIAKQCGMPTDFGWWAWFNRLTLSRCDRLMVLRIPGWEESVGVQGEIKIAEELDIPVEYMDLP